MNALTHFFSFLKHISTTLPPYSAYDPWWEKSPFNCSHSAHTQTWKLARVNNSEESWVHTTASYLSICNYWSSIRKVLIGSILLTKLPVFPSLINEEALMTLTPISVFVWLCNKTEDFFQTCFQDFNSSIEPRWLHMIRFLSPCWGLWTGPGVAEPHSMAAQEYWGVPAGYCSFCFKGHHLSSQLCRPTDEKQHPIK